MTLVEEIRSRLSVLAPIILDIRDDSAQHRGHAGNNGGGHFFLTIASAEFCGKSQVMRHRRVYAILGDLIPQRIHALSIQAIAADEPLPVTID